MHRTESRSDVQVRKNLAVHRSPNPREPLWWSLPLTPRQFLQVFRDDLRGAVAQVFPPSALDAVDAALLSVGDDFVGDELGGEDDAGSRHAAATVQAAQASQTSSVVANAVARRTGTTRATSEVALEVGSVTGVLDLVDRKRVGPARIRIERAPLGRLVEIDIPRDPHLPLQYAFHRPGHTIRALQALAWGRGFTDAAVPVERQLLADADFQRAGTRRLQLVIEGGGARLQAHDEGGRRSTCYLDTACGYVGRRKKHSRWQALREDGRERARRFPVDFVLFAGLPVFIGIFRVLGALQRRLRR